MNEAHHVAMAFDFGRKHIGTAIGQELTGSSRPLATIGVRNEQPDWQAIERLIDKWQPDVLVVGLPLNLDGTKQRMTRLARQFAGELEMRFQRHVVMVDERLTTVAARAALTDVGSGHRDRNKRDKHFIHQAAAQLILEAWFNEQRHENRP